MPKYYDFKVAGYVLYYTSFCTVEAFHVHASDNKLSEAGSGKYFVYKNGDTKVENHGRISKKNENKIRAFIKEHYKEMYNKWKQGGGKPEYYYKSNQV